MNRRRVEAFSETMHRLYHDGDFSPIHVGGNHCMNVTLQVTEFSNMACSYCYQHDKTNRRMSFETAKKFIDLLLAADDRTAGYLNSRTNAGVVIDFIGGEPLLEIDLISDISDYFIAETMRLGHPWATRYRFSICTNGLLYFDPKVQEYLKRHQNHVSLSVTIDGDKKLHDSCRFDLAGNGTYDRAVAAALDYQKRFDKNTGTKVTVSPDNVGFVYQAIKNLVEIGYDDINMNCVFERGWTYYHGSVLYGQLKKIADYLIENDLDEKVHISMLDNPAGEPLPETHNQNWCGGVGLMMCCDPQGDIYPCLRYAPSSIGGNQPLYKIGDVEHGLMKTEEELQRVKCLSCITRRSQSTDECFNCPVATGCGGCSAYNYEVNGTPDMRTTFICAMHKARSLGIVYYRNRAFKKNGSTERFPMHLPREEALRIISEEEYELLLKEVET